MDDDSGTCGICGVDPVEHEEIEIGLTIVNMCEECYQQFEDIAPRVEGAGMNHFKEVCRYCGATIMQCRCPGPKNILYGVCDRCASGKGRLKEQEK